MVSDSESVQSEVISNDRPNPKPSDFSQFFSDPFFASILQQQIATAHTSQLSSLPIPYKSTSQAPSGNPGVSQSCTPSLENGSNQGEDQSLAGNTAVLLLLSLPQGAQVY